MEKDTERIFRIIGKLIKKLTKLTYEFQGEIYNKCQFIENKDEDSRVALMGFIRGELITTHFHFLNILNLNIDPIRKLEYLKQSLGEVSVPNQAIINLLNSHLRRNFTTNIYSLLESGNRKFYQDGNFKKYKNQFPIALVNAYEILRHLRNSMHSNGLFLPTDKSDFVCNYKGYRVEYLYGDFVKTNYKFIYLIIVDSLKLFKEMAIDNLDRNPQFIPIDQNYNIEKYSDLNSKM